ncbi:MAG: hypothetical protein LBD10_08755 [Desulfobulbus sp.]|jgi:DNA-directed RNA polymerase subunit RPC12/RpoP|uniref:hypothetical protein n=1 Tax=Desulfobulbus sp. TaxID=895 RepID=UPI0028400608|nr:hypothetical protein [Desulfobulbus sp.]MDR2550270.1 hypothetical protein [Desulfobulbus sp.]
MKYTCMNCGSTADQAHTLCNPSTDELTSTFCATSTGEICEEKVGGMEYTCGSCGGLSPDAEHLCSPKKIIKF